jgi:hypothetical protein
MLRGSKPETKGNQGLSSKDMGFNHRTRKTEAHLLWAIQLEKKRGEIEKACQKRRQQHAKRSIVLRWPISVD